MAPRGPLATRIVPAWKRAVIAELGELHSACWARVDATTRGPRDVNVIYGLRSMRMAECVAHQLLLLHTSPWRNTDSSQMAQMISA